jgi:CrcB protein
MKQVLLVFIGGGVGSALRYLISKWFNNLPTTLPYGTLMVNVIGSLLIGVILGYAIKSSTFSENYALLLATGFCGGFTTFSAFSYENYFFLKNGDYVSFFSYTLGSVFFALVAVFIGLTLSKLV